MYQGKHHKKTVKRNYKFMVLLVSIVLILSVAVSGTVAFLIDSASVTNTFTPSKVTTSVTEKISGNTKSNVAIKNTGDTTAYIRAAVVVTWQDAAGNVYGQSQPVAGTDYTISYNLSNGGWEQGSDGFYYWTQPVEAGLSTGELITSCTYNANAPKDYGLNVEILGSGIQAEPTSVVTKQWDTGVSSVSGTTLVIK